MRISKIAALAGLAIVALLLFIFSFLLVHNERGDELGPLFKGEQVVDKVRTLKQRGKSYLPSGGRNDLKLEFRSIPKLFSIPMFNLESINSSWSRGSSSHAAREDEGGDKVDDYYYYARDDDDTESRGDGAGTETTGTVATQEGEFGIFASAAATKEKTVSFLDRVILSRLRGVTFSSTSTSTLTPGTSRSNIAQSLTAKESHIDQAQQVRGRDSGSKLQSALNFQPSTSSSASTSSFSRGLHLHPAAPDPTFEPNGQRYSKQPPSLRSKSALPMTCRMSFEPSCPMYKYVRFWNKRFFPEDCYSSPMRHPKAKGAPVSELKYLVFEPDRGGWNNIRMAAETAMIFAHVTGRVLVMPPKTRMYLLDKDQHAEDNESTFSKFFDLSKLDESLTIISMEEFLRDVAAKGLLASPLPDGFTPEKLAASVSRGSERLWKYLESACYVREWEPGKIHLGFNLTRDIEGRPIFGRIDLNDPRVKLHASHSRKLVFYDAQMHHNKAIYFPGDYRNTHRILTHFYSYLYWANVHVEHIYKRLVRDRLHYHDDIFCAAGRVVRMLHEDAAALSNGKFVAPLTANSDLLTLGGNSNQDATYFAYHIRRGDFQYKHTKLSAEEIWANTKHLIAPFVNRTSLIYIATDEKNKKFFEPFRKGFAEHNFKLVFIDDYVRRAFLTDGHLNQNHIGMIEQVICANAHTFIGTPLSTFTGYITRMRGYYRDGRYARTYYTMPQDMYQLHKRPELVGPFWAREFAVAHRDIDDVLSGDVRDGGGGGDNTRGRTESRTFQMQNRPFSLRSGRGNA